ncbi:hypothetical protein JCM3775_003319 [Rhodotorula graminis]
MSATATSTTPLGDYLARSGGLFHPALVSKQDAYGTSIFNGPDALKAGAEIVKCPFALAVTPTRARRSIPTSLFPSSPTSTRKSRQPNHELMALYLCLHVLDPSVVRAIPDLDLAHQVYVDHLPTSESMRTTLYFSPAERELLRGSNLYGATDEREQGWRQEWDEVRGWIADDAVREGLSWDKWLWACTILSSRAFPSSLIDGDKANSTPVLFPGIDMLNHRPTAKVTWSSDVHAEVASSDGEGDKGSLTIVLDEDVPAGEQVFNTYGAKSNEELLLGYGFVLPSNPADFHALKLAIPPSCSPSLFDLVDSLKLDNLRHFVPRSGELPPELLAQMRLLVAQPDELDEVKPRAAAAAGGGTHAWNEVAGFLSWENELDVLASLEGMLESKLHALRQGAAGASAEGVRPEVAHMVEVYRQGQIDILEAAIRYREQLFEATVAKAEEAGVSLAFEDDDEMEDEEEGGESEEEFADE